MVTLAGSRKVGQSRAPLRHCATGPVDPGFHLGHSGRLRTSTRVSATTIYDYVNTSGAGTAQGQH
jgi:hypothetical protein